MTLKKILRFTTAFLFLVQSNLCFAELMPSSLFKTGSLTSEYFVGKELGKPLIQVNLLSGVQKPGVYHIPVGTNLGQLIAYAGGKNLKSNFTSVNIYRKSESGSSKNVKVDLESILEDASSLPGLRAEDIIYINEDRVTLEKTSQWVSIVAGILSIALSAALISQNNNNNN